MLPIRLSHRNGLKMLKTQRITNNRLQTSQEQIIEAIKSLANICILYVFISFSIYTNSAKTILNE